MLVIVIFIDFRYMKLRLKVWKLKYAISHINLCRKASKTILFGTENIRIAYDKYVFIYFNWGIAQGD